PYQRGILDVFHERGVTTAVVMGSSQWGKTACAVNLVAYHIAHDPCPILVVEPTVDPMAKDFARNRLETVIAASPILRERVSKRRAKDSSNTILGKTFTGGFIAIGGANSAASLASRAIRLLVLDEVDRYPAELPGEGSTLSIAIKRTTTYRSRKRIFMPSTPTLKGSTIEKWFLRGDQRRYFVPCPQCGEFLAYEWRNVRWNGPSVKPTDPDNLGHVWKANDDPRSARIHCPHCGHGIDDAERVAILSHGEWRPTAERTEPSIVSFHLWEAYSPLSSLAEIVAGFLRARALQKAGDSAEMHTWQNTTLGEPIEPDKGEGVEPHVLLMRREEVGPEVEGGRIDVPEGGACLTMGVDVQDDRLELLVTGWGVGEESWLVDRQTLPGNTDGPEPWAMLDEVLDHEYRHASGQRIPISATCVDSAGHRTTLVYDYVARRGARRVYAIIGRDGQRPIVSSPSPRKWGREKRKVPLYTIGVDAAKALIVSRLGLTERGPGYVHIPAADWADEELAAQLTSERLVTVFSRGVPAQVWRKTRPRNEALDCAVYALAALRLLHPDLELLTQRLAAGPQEPKGTPAPRRGSGWLGPRRSGWLRR
ncbi:MAG: phage terminase large subunit family protein, partial [Thermoleophilia bacterium]|nr:phage terminase large subunit family protein [Thermoleophilia bacterium]